ncbi:MAG: zinc ribbon domain-containing protein [Candidatus Stahlbacteria bacterium]|nr:zinc ribbon domain-containing protein [Candidatus Stahlbacteria bacterium]
MKCSKCNRDLLEGVKFCVYCGNRILKECPACKTIIPAEREVCESCNLNTNIYAENLRLFEAGKEFEHKRDYEGAKSVYEKISGPDTEGAVKLLGEVNRKIKMLTDNRVKADEYVKHKKWSKARQCLDEIQEILPDDKDVESQLTLIGVQLRRKAIKVWSVVVAVIIIGVGVSYYIHTNTPKNLARSGLIGLLKSDNLEVRNSAALVLGWQGDKSSIPTLQILANSGNPGKSIYSLSALLMLKDPNAVSILRKILCEGNTTERIGAAYALAESGDTAIVPELASYLTSTDEDLRLSASVLLFNFGYSLGIPVIEIALKDTLPNVRYKAVYSLYMLGNKTMLTSHEENWVHCVKNLLWDKSDKAKLLAAFLLNQFSLTLTPQDSIIIGRIIWEEYMNGNSEGKEIFDISAYSIAKGIINRNGDEDITHFAYLSKEIREKCSSALSKIELNDETVMTEVNKVISSTDKYERLYGALTLVKCGNRSAVPVLRLLLKDKDETFRLNVCKLVVEFI